MGQRGSLFVLLGCAFFVAAALGFSFPLLDFELNRMKASGTLIGLNAAMPALGWLIVTPLLPRLQRTIGSRNLALVFLSVAIIAVVAFKMLPDPYIWLPIRFLFGGCIGLLFRVIEFWVNASSENKNRGRNIGFYASTFCIGGIVGSLLVPVIGTQGWAPYLVVCTMLFLGCLPILFAKQSLPEITHPPKFSLKQAMSLLPLAMMAVLIWGMFETIAYTFTPIYSLRIGFGEDIAALTVTAYLIGAFIFPVPLGMLGDRYDRSKLLIGCAVVALISTCLIPQLAVSPNLFLLNLVFLGGIGGGMYIVTMAIIAERYSGAELAATNAAFGTFYALGNLGGPIIHGAAMDVWDPHGIIVSASCLFTLFLLYAIWNSKRASVLQAGE